MRLKNSGEPGNMSGLLMIEYEVLPKGINIYFGCAIDEKQKNCLEEVLLGGEVLRVILAALSFCDAYFVKIIFGADFTDFLTKVFHFLFLVQDLFLEIFGVSVYYSILIS